MNLFVKWRHDFGKLNINLIIGNHDILEAAWYEKMNIVCYKEQFRLGNFVFSHDELKALPETDCYLFSGHIHPAVSLHGTAKQSLKFPCFCFGKSSALIPAFGRFTGLHTINRQKTDCVFAIVENKIMKLN
jgi:metallophosphoesterase superfamily enzyme